ncbi:cytochrome C [Sphingopyxis macrogoltabida]|uniref:Cytochrome C n=1 Tax=Sphingopyxis macrogoltabida TaxID=33050 RepID=A0A0N9U8P6_SPHMC|nr:cytochrome C [Sphingopyxis macrogoltabida]ALH79340.1 cytochrome C [Sphingopyxis macrogoltabida]
MKWLAVPALMLATGAAVATPVSGSPSSSETAAMPGVANPARARQNWILTCQGCHRADATGSPQTTPTMAGFVAQFLQVPGGREYLAQVPGVATAALSDEALAEVLNWSLLRFDPAHVPGDFTPYTPAEVGRLRLKPLRTEAAAVRAGMVARFAPAGKP